MKAVKWVLGIVVVLLVIAGIALLILGVFINDAAKEGIEVAGSAVTGTSVTVDSVDISIFRGEGSASSLTINNPEGFSDAGALNIGSAAVKVDPGTIFSNPVVINSIIVDGAELSLESGKGGLNLKKIYDHINSLMEPEPAESDTKVIIDLFQMKACTLRIDAKGLKKTVPLPEIELKDIGRKTNGQTKVEAAKQILKFVFQKALKTGTEAGVKGAIMDKLGGAGEKLKGLFNR